MPTITTTSAQRPSTPAADLLAAHRTLAAHGIRLDGCTLPNESILAIAAIASGDSRATLGVQAAQVKAA